MKIAVITPHWNTKPEYLHRNLSSVAAQETSHPITHFLVADGYDCAEQEKVIADFKNVIHLKLPIDCADAGATPAVMATYMAYSMGFEAFAYLGDDNIFTPNHVESCVSKYLETGSEVIYSQRFFMTPDGETLSIPEEPDHVDANCLFLFGKSVRFSHMMAMMPKPLLQINDRIFSRALATRCKFSATGLKTVGYATRWANHYRFVGMQPPEDCKEPTPLSAQKWLDETPIAEKNDWMNYLLQINSAYGSNKSATILGEAPAA